MKNFPEKYSEKVKKFIENQEKRLDSVMSALTNEEQEELIRLLRKIMNSLTQ